MGERKVLLFKGHWTGQHPEKISLLPRFSWSKRAYESSVTTTVKKSRLTLSVRREDKLERLALVVPVVFVRDQFDEEARRGDPVGLLPTRIVHVAAKPASIGRILPYLLDESKGKDKTQA